MKLLRISLILFTFNINAAPKISVIIPVYNTERFLRECLDSILNQTFTDFEVICIDDASPDRCSEILQEYAAKDGRVRVIHHEKNAGIAAARNTGLDAATGEYIAFSDSDDYMHPDMFKIMYREIRRNNSDFVCCKYSRPNENDKPLFIKNIPYTIEILKDSSLLRFYQEKSFSPIWNCLYKKSIIAPIKLDPELFGTDDSYFNFCTSRFVKKCVKISAKLYAWRNRISSTSNSTFFAAKMMDGFYKLVEKICNSSYESIPLSFEQKRRICCNLAIKEADNLPMPNVYEKLFYICKFMEHLYSRGFIDLEHTAEGLPRILVALLVGIGKIQKLVGVS
jgi:glycosyltransferase involved in cell wall biosynthesis